MALSVSAASRLDLLEVPQRNRTAGPYRCPAQLMAEFGRSAVRVWDMTRGGYKGQLREFVSEAHIEIGASINACRRAVSGAASVGAVLIEYRASPVQS